MKSMIKSLINKAPVTYAPTYRTNAIYAVDSQSPSESYLRAYQKSGTVYGVVSLFAQSVAFPEWRMYRKTTDNRVRYSTADTGSDQRTEVIQHQALNVINYPNPFMTRVNLFEISQTFLDLTGESWWIIDYAGSIPVGIWPVRPDAMSVVPDPVNFLKGYVYTGPGGEKIPFQPNEIVFVKMPNPLNMYRGQSFIQTVMADVDAGNYGAQYNRNFFLNDATPGGVIQTPNEVTEEEFDNLTNRWRESHKGMSRAHRVAILENGMQWVETKSNQKDMDFVNLINNSRDKIREAAKVHKIMLGQSDDVNRANAQTGEEVHNTWQTIPRLNRWKDALNFQYLPLFGSTGVGVEFDYMTPSPNNREQDNAELVSKSTSVLTLIEAGFDPTEALEVVGLPDMKVVATAKPAPKAPVPLGTETALQAPDGSQPPVSSFLASIRNEAGSAAMAYEDAAEDYPPDAMAWMHDADWKGPVMIPLQHLDLANRAKWAAEQEDDKVDHFKKEIQIKGSCKKPVIAVKTPDSHLLRVADGHHRVLASLEMNTPVRGYVGTVKAENTGWLTMHDSQGN